MSEDHLGEFSAMFLTKPVVHEKILNDDPKKNQSIDIIDTGRHPTRSCMQLTPNLDNNYKLKNIKFRIRTWTIILIVDYSDVVSLVTQQIGYPATMKYIWHHCSKTFIKECLAFDIFFIFYFQFFISQLSDDNSSRINSLNIKEKIEKLKYRKNSYTLLLVGEIISYSKSESFEIKNKKFELSDLSENFSIVVIDCMKFGNVTFLDWNIPFYGI